MRRAHHAAGAAVAEAARHQDAVRAVAEAVAALLLERLGLDPLHVDLDAVLEAAVDEGLVQALVRVLEADVLADDVDRHLALRLPDALDERGARSVRRARGLAVN